MTNGGPYSAPSRSLLTPDQMIKPTFDYIYLCLIFHSPALNSSAFDSEIPSSFTQMETSLLLQTWSSLLFLKELLLPYPMIYAYSSLKQIWGNSFAKRPAGPSPCLPSPLPSPLPECMYHTALRLLPLMQECLAGLWATLTWGPGSKNLIIFEESNRLLYESGCLENSLS